MRAAANVHLVSVEACASTMVIVPVAYVAHRLSGSFEGKATRAASMTIAAIA